MQVWKYSVSLAEPKADDVEKKIEVDLASKYDPSKVKPIHTKSALEENVDAGKFK